MTLRTASVARRLTRRAAVLSVAALLSAAGLAGAADWTEYRGPENDGHSAETGVAEKFTAAPKLAWKVPVGEGFGTFAVAGDRAYLFMARQNRETLACLDAKTGKEIWARPVDQTIQERSGGPNPRSTPTIDGDRVYVFTVNFKLLCLGAADGKELWAVDVAAEKGVANGLDIKRWGNAASPVLDGDRIYVAGGGPGNAMAAVDKMTGKVLWATGDEQVTHASPVPATIHGVRQVVHLVKSGLVALAADGGKELWRAPFPFATSTAASPVVGTGSDANVVYCSAGYGVGSTAVEVTKEGGAFAAKPLWFEKAGADPQHTVHHWSTPVYHDGHVYGIFGFKDYANKGPGAPVGCREMRTGKFKWRQPGFGSGGGTVFVDGHLLVQGDAGKLALIKATPAGYEEKATVTVPGEKFWSAAIVANGKVYTRSRTEAFCYDLGE
jgi:outer membrane protein assembly factor BamB